MKAAKINLEIPQGRTFSQVLRWGQSRLAYRQIQAATKAAPCVLTANSHGVPDGWSFRISDCRGMAELNADRYYRATVLDDDHIELNDVNAVSFATYTGSGIITYNMPVDLAAISGAAMQVRKSISSPDVLLSLTTDNGGIVIDEVANTITIQASAVQTAEISWSEGVYDIETTSPGGIVLPLAYGAVKVVREVTR